MAGVLQLYFWSHAMLQFVLYITVKCTAQRVAVYYGISTVLIHHNTQPLQHYLQVRCG